MILLTLILSFFLIGLPGTLGGFLAVAILLPLSYYFNRKLGMPLFIFQMSHIRRCEDTGYQND